MAIQSHAPIIIAHSGTNNLPGAWGVLIPEVTTKSVWVVAQMSPTTAAPSGTVMATMNLELGAGPVGEEVRRWKSLAYIMGGGGELEFDDSFAVKYVPFNFRKGEQVSARIAAISFVATIKAAIQIQLYS